MHIWTGHLFCNTHGNYFIRIICIISIHFNFRLLSVNIYFSQIKLLLKNFFFSKIIFNPWSQQLTRMKPYEIFKSVRGRRSCSTRKTIKAPKIHQFNPIRSTGAMTELSKKRWVSLICAVLIFSCATPLSPPKVTCFV